MTPDRTETGHAAPPLDTGTTSAGGHPVPNDAAIARAAEFLRAARSVLVITGAGVSAASGLPTYRGVGGLYEGRRPDEGLPIEEILSGRVFAARPELTWKYLLEIEKAGRDAKPNRGHEVIAAMEGRFDRAWVLTQNVDGLHHRAGSRNVIDIHGDLRDIRCTRCPYRTRVETYEGFDLPPRCPDCRGVLRPGVILFGEQLPARQLATYRAETARGFDVVLSVGTTSVFPYISAPVLDAYHSRKPSVEINPGDTDVSEFATVRVRLGAAAALGAIWAAL